MLAGVPAKRVLSTSIDFSFDFRDLKFSQVEGTAKTN
jgi:hypothetical protein